MSEEREAKLGIDFNQFLLNTNRQPMKLRDGAVEKDMRLGDIVCLVLLSDLPNEKQTGLARRKRVNLAEKIQADPDIPEFPVLALSSEKKTLIEKRAEQLADAGGISSLVYTRLYEALEGTVQEEEE